MCPAENAGTRRRVMGKGSWDTDTGEVTRGAGAKPGVSSAGSAGINGQVCQPGLEGLGYSPRRLSLTLERADSG